MLKLQGRLMATGLGFPEGPVVLPDGSVLVVEIAAGRLTRVLPNGELKVIAHQQRKCRAATYSVPPSLDKPMPFGWCTVCRGCASTRWRSRRAATSASRRAGAGGIRVFSPGGDLLEFHEAARTCARLSSLSPAMGNSLRRSGRGPD